MSNVENDIKIIEDLIRQNEGAIKEAKASNDINSMNLIADMDSQNKALKHLLQVYKEDEAVIEEMSEYIGKDIRCIRPEIECNKMTHDCAKCVEEYFRNKVKREKR